MGQMDELDLQASLRDCLLADEVLVLLTESTMLAGLLVGADLTLASTWLSCCNMQLLSLRFR